MKINWHTQAIKALTYARIRGTCGILLRIKKNKQNLNYNCNPCSKTLNLFLISTSYNLLLLSRNPQTNIFWVYQHVFTQNTHTQIEYLCAHGIMCVLACVTCMADGFWTSICRRRHETVILPFCGTAVNATAAALTFCQCVQSTSVRLAHLHAHITVS